MQSEKWNVNSNGRSFPKSAAALSPSHIVRLQYKHWTEQQWNIYVVSLFMSMQMCHYKSAKLPLVPAQWAGEVSSVWSLVAAWRPSQSQLHQNSGSQWPVVPTPAPMLDTRGRGQWPWQHWPVVTVVMSLQEHCLGHQNASLQGWNVSGDMIQVAF